MGQGVAKVRRLRLWEDYEHLETMTPSWGVALGQRGCGFEGGLGRHPCWSSGDVDRLPWVTQCVNLYPTCVHASMRVPRKCAWVRNMFNTRLCSALHRLLHAIQKP